MTVKAEMEESVKAAQLEQLLLENQKLKVELDGLTRGRPLQHMVTAITTGLAILTFAFGLYRYQVEQQKNRDIELLTEERERMRPWLASQREVYSEALAAAAGAAVTDPPAFPEARRKFLTLYHGRMVLVETGPIAVAMTDVKAFMDNPDAYSQKERSTLVHSLATKMHDSMAATSEMTFDEFAKNQFRYEAASHTRAGGSD